MARPRICDRGQQLSIAQFHTANGWSDDLEHRAFCLGADLSAPIVPSVTRAPTFRRFDFSSQPEGCGDARGEWLVNIWEMRNQALADGRFLHVAQFEDQRGGDAILFHLRLADVELAALAIFIAKCRSRQLPAYHL